MILLKRKSLLIILFSLAFAIVAILFRNTSSDGHLDLDKTIQEIISSRGFEHETHFIETSDGYILQTIRIINPHVKDRVKLKPILLHHGFQCSGSVWLVALSGKLQNDGKYLEDHNLDDENEIGNSLGFVLAARGYDVWLANYRGNIYSTNHTSLSVNDEKFWNFSADEMIEIDLPTKIDYILNITKQKTISYIGHSLGSAAMFGLLATQPRYSEIIKPAIALSPVGYQTNYEAPLKHFSVFRRLVLKYLPKDFGTNYLRKIGLPTLCTNRFLQESVCYWVYWSLMGSPREQVDLKRLPVYFDNILHGSSTRTLLHFFQHTLKCQPIYYDYDDEDGTIGRNYQKYGRHYPPIYQNFKINSTHIAFIYTKRDWFNHLADVHLMKDNLNVKLIDDYAVPDESWNHMDLLWGKQVGKYVNARVLKILDNY